MATLYFTKFADGEKQILTQQWFESANDVERIKVKPIWVYQLRDFSVSEFERIMNIPFKDALDQYFPNI